MGLGGAWAFRAVGARALAGAEAGRVSLGRLLGGGGTGRGQRGEGKVSRVGWPVGAQVRQWEPGNGVCVRRGRRVDGWGHGAAAGGGSVLMRPAAPPTGAQTPASPARCRGARCRPWCPCACASSSGAACAAASASSTCRTRSSRPSAPTAATSGETWAPPSGQGTPRGCSWAHRACCPPPHPSPLTLQWRQDHHSGRRALPHGAEGVHGRAPHRP